MTTRSCQAELENSFEHSSWSYDDSDQFLQLFYHYINFSPGIVFTKTKTNGYLVGIVVDGTDDVTALVGTARAGAAAAGANIINVEIKKYHLRFFRFWETGAKYGI